MNTKAPIIVSYIMKVEVEVEVEVEEEEEEEEEEVVVVVGVLVGALASRREMWEGSAAVEK